MKLNRRRGVAVAAVLMCGLAAACGGDDSSNDPAGDGDAGDGDGDTGDGDGDGDGDTPGDGDGDGSGGMSGDGDGDTGGTPGDGDGDMGGMPGDGDGDMGGAGPVDPAMIDGVFAGKVDVAGGLYGVDFAPNGNIYVSGELEVNTGTEQAPVLDMHVVVARYLPDGTLDTTFGTEGSVLINTIASGDDLTASAPGDEGTSTVASMPDGGAVVGISANDGALGGDVYLARLDEDGDLVTGFGTNGIAKVDLSGWELGDWTTAGGTDGPSDRLYDVKLDTSGAEERLVLFGYGPAPAGGTRIDNDRYVARVLASDGSLDPSFSGDGVFSIDFGEYEGSDSARRGAVLEDGSIYSFGYTNYGGDDDEGVDVDMGGRHHIQILHLDESGEPVEGFGFQANADTCGAPQDGVICANPNLAGGGFAEAYSAALQSDGSIVTTGYGRADDAELPPDVVSFRFGPTEMDTSYGTAGALIIDSGAEDRGRDIVVLDDDRAVHAGKYAGVAAIFVTTADGQLWDGFGDGGVRVYPTHDGNFRGLATQDGVIAAVADGGSDTSSYLVILTVAE